MKIDGKNTAIKIPELEHEKTAPSLRDYIAETANTACVAQPQTIDEALILLDHDLMRLNKELQTFASELASAKKSGQKGLVDLLKSRYDAALSAFETRMAEAKDNQKLLCAAQKAVNESLVAGRNQLRAEELQNSMNAAFAARAKKQEKQREEKEKGGLLFYFFIGYWLAQMLENQRKNHEKHLSSMQNDFQSSTTGTA